MRIAVSTKDNGEFCVELNSTGELTGPIESFCELSPTPSYLQVYSIVIGDFNLSDYTATVGLTILFTIVTLIGVVIMLNVLIAVISDSYEKAKIGSVLLFGRARVSFVAQNQALESFLRPGTDPIEGLKALKTSGMSLVIWFKLLRWLVLISLVVTGSYALVYLGSRFSLGLVGKISFFKTIFVFCVLIVLAPALWILLFFAIGDVLMRCIPRSLDDYVQSIDKAFKRVIHVVAANLFGLGETARTRSLLEDEATDIEEEWIGQLTYIEKAIDRTIMKSNQDLRAAILALEKRIYTHETIRMNEQKKNHKDLSPFQS